MVHECKRRSICNIEKHFLKIVGIKHVGDMLELISEKNCSAQVLSKELDIPLASVYRKLKVLEDANFIYCAKITMKRSGNEEKYYGCLIDDVTINFHEGSFSINLHQKENCKTIVKIWGN